MTDPVFRLDPAAMHSAATTRPVRDREGTTMLLHEALARSRMFEAEQAARRFRLARSATAGRRWAWLARFAQRRAQRAGSGLGAVPHTRRGVLRSV